MGAGFKRATAGPDDCAGQEQEIKHTHISPTLFFFSEKRTRSSSWEGWACFSWCRSLLHQPLINCGYLRKVWRAKTKAKLMPEMSI